jgi:SPX domain protein involved in polyphosphate accumulation
MKFSKDLASKTNPSWAPYYVQYKRLKKILKPCEKRSNRSSFSEGTPADAARDEADKALRGRVSQEFLDELQQVGQLCARPTVTCSRRLPRRT